MIFFWLVSCCTVTAALVTHPAATSYNKTRSKVREVHVPRVFLGCNQIGRLRRSGLYPLQCNEKGKKIKTPRRFGRGTMVIIRLKDECLYQLVTNVKVNLILVARYSRHKYYETGLLDHKL